MGELFKKQKNLETRWISFENKTGDKGMGGMENKGAKGHASQSVQPGESIILMDFKGSGVIRRIWMTVSHYNEPKILRGIKLEMYWDNAAAPAVSAPLGDFFGVGLGRKVPFESELFSDPEGRSFNCFIPMPFKTGAKVVLANENKDSGVDLFYDIDLTIGDKFDDDTMYFHTYWHRAPKTTLGVDFEILPKIKGSGRFLGTNVGVIEDPAYEGQWFGEGEVKVYIDGDNTYPTLVGTGTEDYIGTAWGQGQYCHRYQGCTIVDYEKREFAFYRYHIIDPIYFNEECRTTIQQIGGAQKSKILEAVSKGAKIKPVTVSGPEIGFIKLFETNEKPSLEELPSDTDFWCNYYREDDVSATAYFYLDKPENGLPRIQSIGERIEKL